MNRTILTVIGARPQFVKAGVVSKAIAERTDLDEVLVNTGQHYDANMAGIFFRDLRIPKPKYELHVGSGSHGAQTGKILQALDPVLEAIRPAAVIVYGDTNSTLAGALAAVKQHIPVVHIEAGLRSFNRRMPEEVNRVVADHLASVLYAPTESAISNLTKEGLAGDGVCWVGDVMYDVALSVAHRDESPSESLRASGIGPDESYILATIHRAENTDDRARLTTIFSALAKLARDLPIILPVHPRTRNALQSGVPELVRPNSGLKLIDPVGYLEMAKLERGATLIVTDSGGVQKEAYFHRVPCVTLRAETEWIELVNAGWNRLAPPTSAESIVRVALAALNHRPSEYPAFYGEGNASVKIALDLTGRIFGGTLSV